MKKNFRLISENPFSNFAEFAIVFSMQITVVDNQGLFKYQQISEADSSVRLHMPLQFLR